MYQGLDLVKEVLQSSPGKSPAGPVNCDLKKDRGCLQYNSLCCFCPTYLFAKSKLEGCLVGCITESELGSGNAFLLLFVFFAIDF